MSPACERNAAAEIRILAQRTVVCVGKGGVPDCIQRQGAPSWTQVTQEVVVPVAPQVDTAANLPERLVESHESNFFGQTAARGGRFVFHGSVGDASVSSIKNWAVVVSAGSKLQDIPLADLARFCKGTQKTWSDGKNFTLVIKDPESPEMKVAIQKLFGLAPNEVKAMIATLNELRQVVKIVDSEADLLRTVEATPGAVGIVDVYLINSSVKVLRVDGKLPFDLGYALKGN
jgi:hypothetical protein